MRLLLIFVLAAAAGAQPAETVVDRIAVVVGKQILTESEVLENLRITALINGEALDVGAAKRKEAAERLVDQELLRNEMKLTNAAPTQAAEAESVLRQFIGKRYPNESAYREALTAYGVTENELKQQLAWQVALLRFTEQRFRPLANLAAAVANTQVADRLRPGAATNGAEPAANADTVDQQMETFLKQARSNTKVIFKAGAFQ
jgi:hypothetical protein